jgi:hypothetical protein
MADLRNRRLPAKSRSQRCVVAILNHPLYVGNTV